MKNGFQIKLFALLFPILSILPGASFAQGWQWQNPRPHGLAINDVVMYGTGRAVAVCNSGYIMYSGDEGKTWISRHVAEVDFESIEVSGDGTLLIASDKGRIYRSTNHASTWEIVYRVPAATAGFSTDLDRIDAHSFLAMFAGNHFAATYDDGATWEEFSVPFSGNESGRSLSAQSFHTWWIGTNRNVHKTTDGGKSWTQAPEIDPRGLSRFVFADSLYGYQLRNGRLMQTYDGGGSWLEMDIFGFGQVLDLVAGPQTQSNVYVLSEGRYLVNKSPDAGETWNISLTESAFQDAYPTGIAFTTPDIGVVVGDGGRILRTENGGSSWSIVHGIGYIGTMADIVFTTPEKGIALSYSRTVLLTGNGGTRWTETIPDSDYALRMISMAEENTGFSVGFSDDDHFGVFRTTDAGWSWEKRSDLPIVYDPWQPILPQSIVAVNESELWVGASYNITFRSTDGGLHWDSLYVGDQWTVPQFNSGMDLYHFPPSTIVYTRMNGISISTDDGDTWDSRNETSGQTLWQTEFVSPETGFTLLSGQFAGSSDGGRSWRHIGDWRFQLFHFFDDRNGVAVWNDSNNDNLGYLMKTTDGGESWQQFTLREKVSWNNWHFIDPDEGWAIGYGGLIRHTSNGGIVSVRDTPQSARETQQAGREPLQTDMDFSLGQSYPNPLVLNTRPAMVIPFSIRGGSRHVVVEVYNSLGRRIATLLDDRRPEGSHVISYTPSSHTSTLVPGVYTYILRSGNSMLTRSFVVIK